jgi:uncharacterized OB-fold protein
MISSRCNHCGKYSKNVNKHKMCEECQKDFERISINLLKKYDEVIKQTADR